MSQEISADVAIVGSGPVGLFAVFECGMLKLSSVLIDALGEVGGQCTAFNPERPIYDVPAHQAIAAGDLVSRLEEKSAPFKPARLLGRRVERLSGAPGDFRPVSATNGMSATARPCPTPEVQLTPPSRPSKVELEPTEPSASRHSRSFRRALALSKADVRRSAATRLSGPGAVALLSGGVCAMPFFYTLSQQGRDSQLPNGKAMRSSLRTPTAWWTAWSSASVSAKVWWAR